MVDWYAPPQAANPSVVVARRAHVSRMVSGAHTPTLGGRTIGADVFAAPTAPPLFDPRTLWYQRQRPLVLSATGPFPSPLPQNGRAIAVDVALAASAPPLFDPRPRLIDYRRSLALSVSGHREPGLYSRSVGSDVAMAPTAPPLFDPRTVLLQTRARAAQSNTGPTEPGLYGATAPLFVAASAPPLFDPRTVQQTRRQMCATMTAIGALTASGPYYRPFSQSQIFS